MAEGLNALERDVDFDSLFGAYTCGIPPTRYLSEYTSANKLQIMDAVARKRTGRPGTAYR